MMRAYSGAQKLSNLRFSPSVNDAPLRLTNVAKPGSRIVKALMA